VNAAAALWGFAEATLFFVVPDVLLTDRAATSLRAALAACLWSLAGALAGGAAMYAWGASAPERALAALDAVPGVGPAMIVKVEADVRRHGVLALFAGPLTGRPYKVYAVQAARSGTGLPLFLAVSVPARLGRFLLLTLAAGALARGPLRRSPPRRVRLGLAVFWAIFYVAYFWRVEAWAKPRTVRRIQSRIGEHRRHPPEEGGSRSFGRRR
jgi:membrane protein YqaA with SNARE-associated domain